jgi:hypothetical protein
LPPRHINRKFFAGSVDKLESLTRSGHFWGCARGYQVDHFTTYDVRHSTSLGHKSRDLQDPLGPTPACFLNTGQRKRLDGFLGAGEAGRTGSILLSRPPAN